MSVKALLDDVAAEAIAGLRIDLAAAQRQADRQRSRLRQRASAAMACAVAVAAVVTLIAVLMPGGVFRAETPPAAVISGQPTGLPDHWYYAPPWTPPVTRHPMAAASMVLAVGLQSGWTAWPGPAPVPGAGPVLVSADGTSYASLPWRRGDSLVALAPSGRDVAWVSQAPEGAPGEGPKRAVVHRIRLSDGGQQNAELPAGLRVERLLWDGDRLVAVLPGAKSGFEWTAGSKVLTATSDLPAAVDDGQSLLDGADSPFFEGDRIVSQAEVRDPSGTRTADVVQSVRAGKVSFGLLIAGGAAADLQIPITGGDPITHARVLGWADGGIVVRIRSQGQVTSATTLRLYSPDGSTMKIVSRRSGTWEYPIAVAPEVVGGGVTVPGVVPSFPRWDRSHLRYLIRQTWAGVNVGYLVAGLVGVLGLGLWRRQRKRRRRPLEVEADTPPV
jgi:hypothetical protein